MKPESFVQKSEYASSKMVSLIIRHIWVTIKIVESVFGQLRKIISISTTTLLGPYMIKQHYLLFVEFFLQFSVTYMNVVGPLLLLMKLHAMIDNLFL